jgi:type I restriction enzyme R subunit
VFEDELCAHLAANQWVVRTHLKDATSYDRELAIFPDDLLAFVQATQSEEWAKFRKWHNGDAEQVFIKRVAQQLDKHGTLHVLRNGFKDRDAKFVLCQFRPAHQKNPTLWEAYKQNRLTVIRQLHYSLHNENSIDLVLFVNGLPVATSELKTDLTQNIRDAIVQYKKDRQPRDTKTKQPEPLLEFKTRALVHFAVSTDEVFMTTQLKGEKTFFLPFNQGRPDGFGGATSGNPPAPLEIGYPTGYLWHWVWHRDVWLDILGNFLHLEKKEVEDPKTGAKSIKETLIFPRFHQLDVVLRLVRAAAEEGTGKTWLVQHSAGSGKSNSIAWTAHRLANLHNARDEKVFNSVIVITDRKVLDRQLQETISQFEHKAGVVQKIDRNSQQLADALNDGAPIIVTTLQKFPNVLEKVTALKKRNFALIIDEAHSSQSGSVAQKLRKALTTGDGSAPAFSAELDATDYQIEQRFDFDPDSVTAEDVINQVISARKRPDNVSYFAFTATPKAKTLELFGRKGPDGLPEPFHVYSMRQAIDEGFILDVLKHYISYKAYYKLGSASESKLVPAGRAKKTLARYAALHAYNIAQKVVVIVEHFREFVAHRIGGCAKAMVVTDSRVSAVRYKLAMDKYIKERGYQNLKTLVAFSGKVSDLESGPDDFTEANMNPGVSGEPSEAFKGDDFRLLLVANKYQTGFDQPLLHTMYVDKRLSGVLAVQTLSRLNRTCAGKDDTFVLDFVNKPEEILESFLPYYRSARLEGETDPNIVHELQLKLDKSGVYYPAEVEAFAEAFFDPKRKQSTLHGFLKPAADRFFELSEEEADQFRKDLGAFLRLYDFLSQIVPYEDTDLEKRYAFGKILMPRITEGTGSSILELDSDVRLTHYRLQKLGEQQLKLESGEQVTLAPVTEAGSGKAREDEMAPLSEIVEKMNDLFAGGVTEADALGTLTAWSGHLLKNEKLADQAKNNSLEQFVLGDFKEIFTDVVLESQDGHNKIANQLLKDERIFAAMQEMLAQMVYSAFRRDNASSGSGV